MKQRISKRILSLILCLLVVVSNSITALATSDTGEVQEVAEASTVLVDVEEAQHSLQELVAEREIPALLYLKDIYTIKAEPDSNSGDVASISSGQQVYITGVGEDKGHNIWYQVTYSYDGGDLSGYIQREFLAFSDERLIEWEGMHVRSRQMFRMFRSAGINYADVDQFPESYQDALYRLKQQHPNWKFVKMDTGLDWNYVVNVQSQADRSLVSNNGALDSWKDGYYSKSWSIASDGIIKYYLDPRNALSEKLIFQFEQLTYNRSYHSVESVQKVVQGTFMDGMVPGESISYAQAFMNIAAERNLSPVLMAARVRQEQGVNGSQMISGKYPGFEGLYNHYNIGASGNTQEKELQTGLTKAREMGWTTPMRSLSGGSAFLSNSYIHRGQDTLYLQKFDVDSSYDGVCWHQYMQNIAAPESEALSTYRAYSNAGIVDSAFVFRIPVYRNMPSYACTKPGSEEKITLNVSTVDNLPVNGTAVLHSYINGSLNTSVAMDFTSSDTNVATVDSNGVVTGISPGKATITCKRLENAEGATTATCQVTVIKADIEISKIEIPDIEVTYSDSQKLSSVELPEGFSWVDTDIVPTVENNGYNVVYNPDSSKYNPVTITVPVTVKKAVVDSASLSLPSGLSTVAGYELSSVALPSGYAWDNPSEILPKKVGTYSYGASYCVDEVNYEILEDITLSVEVVCKTHEFGDWQGTHADCVNDGEMTRACGICGATEMVAEDDTIADMTARIREYFAKYGCFSLSVLFDEFGYVLKNLTNPDSDFRLFLLKTILPDDGKIFGRLQRQICIPSNITEEEVTQTLAERIREMLQGYGDAVCIDDLDNELPYLNKSALEMILQEHIADAIEIKVDGLSYWKLVEFFCLPDDFAEYLQLTVSSMEEAQTAPSLQTLSEAMEKQYGEGFREIYAVDDDDVFKQIIKVCIDDDQYSWNRNVFAKQNAGQELNVADEFLQTQQGIFHESEFFDYASSHRGLTNTGMLILTFLRNKCIRLDQTHWISLKDFDIFSNFSTDMAEAIARELDLLRGSKAFLPLGTLTEAFLSNLPVFTINEQVFYWNHYLLASVAAHKISEVQVINDEPSPYTVTAMTIPQQVKIQGDVIDYIFQDLRKTHCIFSSANDVFEYLRTHQVRMVKTKKLFVRIRDFWGVE